MKPDRYQIYYSYTKILGSFHSKVYPPWLFYTHTEAVIPSSQFVCCFYRTYNGWYIFIHLCICWLSCLIWCKLHQSRELGVFPTVEFSILRIVLLLLLLLSLVTRVRLCATPETAGSPPGSPVPGILQARTLEWVAISFSKDSANHIIVAHKNELNE